MQKCLEGLLDVVRKYVSRDVIEMEVLSIRILNFLAQDIFLDEPQ